MAHIRAANGREQAIPGPLVTPLLATKPRSRACPKCEAQPGRPCRRWVGGRVRGHDIGGGYWKPLKNVHDERKNLRASGVSR